MKNIAVIGYSGHAYVALDTAREIDIDVQYYCERVENKFNPYRLRYIGFESETGFDWSSVDAFILGIGNNVIRKKVADLVLSKKKEILNIIHPLAAVSLTSKFGTGNFISINTIVSAFTEIGNFCILNSGCIVEHECKIADAVHLAPGVVLTGNVSIGENSFIGANAVVKQGINIGRNVTVGAGSVVLKDIPQNEIWVGNPARKLEK